MLEKLRRDLVVDMRAVLAVLAGSATFPPC